MRLCQWPQRSYMLHGDTLTEGNRQCTRLLQPEQSSGIQQINLAITSMDETTQQNAALVEEAMAAAHALEEQAQRLLKTVSVFKL